MIKALFGVVSHGYTASQYTSFVTSRPNSQFAQTHTSHSNFFKLPRFRHFGAIGKLCNHLQLHQSPCKRRRTVLNFRALLTNVEFVKLLSYYPTHKGNSLSDLCVAVQELREARFVQLLVVFYVPCINVGPKFATNNKFTIDVQGPGRSFDRRCRHFNSHRHFNSRRHVNSRRPKSRSLTSQHLSYHGHLS